ncbi:MAG TPA: type II secretion system protein [Polyangiaceae bacterium]|jgi:type II secretory pathway pseudopilin PulG
MSAARNLRRRARRELRLPGRRKESGFTLVELLVSMVAGLMVALAVVAMSREASGTFHEETRIAGAQMQIRAAMDRLRADVARASFMSTGNIWIDPMIPTGAGTVMNVAQITAISNSNHMSIQSLAGIRLFSGGSALATPGSAVNGVSPDAIEIAGNMTSVYELAIGGATGTTSPVVAGAGCNGGGQRVYLDVDSSPSLWLLVGMQTVGGDAGTSGTPAAYATALNNVFQPVAGAQFIVRIVDSNGKSQYAATCATQAAGWNVVGTNNQPYVDLDSTTPVTMSGTGGNTATINPVQIVRWQIEPGIVGFAGDAGGDSTKYDLTRQYLDFKGNALAASKEVVGEYVADLKFAFTVDNTNLTTGNFPSSTASSQVVLSLEDSTTNAAVAGDVTKETINAPTTSLTPAQTDLSGPQPQRIRSVRVRLVTRAETPDRGEPLDAGAGYLYRYCTATSASGCVAGANVFARTRTLITEVALPNQARFWYR